jgi:hypothetical protein
MAAFIVGEGNWLPLAMTAALIASAALFLTSRTSAASHRSRTMATMNLFVGVMLMVMGIGHTLAVTVKLAQQTLRGWPLLLYVIGAAIMLPSFFVIRHTSHLLRASDDGRVAMKLHGWLAATLVILGLINTPLAIPAILSMAYARHSRRAIGVAIVTAFVLVNAGLLFGGLMFLFSGARTFEEFSNMP